MRNILISSIFISLLSAHSAFGEKFSFERGLMGTKFTIVCYAENKATAEKAADKAFSLAEELNAIASDYLPESELVSLSSKPIETPIAISPMLFELLNHSRKIAEATAGAYDPTFGPLTKIWRQSRDDGKLPDPEKLKAARAAVGWKNFTLNKQTCSITLLKENMSLDLGGIAKGYAADLMLEAFVAAGLKQTMITAGGDVRLGDAPPGRDGWHVAVQTFEKERSDEILVLSNAAVSTSGDLHQSVEIDGVKYSHVLDPNTGLGLTHRVAATVIADHALLSDSLATAACVSGEKGSEALKKIAGVRDVKIRTSK